MSKPGFGRQVVAAPAISGRAFAPEKPVKYAPKASGFDYLIRDDGSIAIKPNKLEVDHFYLEYHATYIYGGSRLVRYYELVGTFTRNKHGLIGLPKYFEYNKFSFKYTGGAANENYISGNALAALFGALKEAGFCDISLNHWSNADGTSPAPSRSHKLGKNGDIRPLRTDHLQKRLNIIEDPTLYDQLRNQRLVNALRKFGWKSILFYRNPKTGHLPLGTKYDKNHYDHFHIQGFQPKIVRYK